MEAIEKLSMADANIILQFLKSLKLVVDKFEHEKQLKLERNQNCALYVIDNDEIVQVTSIISIKSYELNGFVILFYFPLGTQFCNKEYLSKEVVVLINKLNHKINDMEHKVRIF